VICGLQEELEQRHEVPNSERKALREEKHRIESELARLVESIATGKASTTVMSAIAQRESRIAAITNKIIEPGPDSLQEKLDELRTLPGSRLTQLRGLLTNPSTIHEARALLAKQIGKFTLERIHEDGKFSFKADGQIDFFGEEAMARTGGAGGPGGTERYTPFTLRVVA
jgi:hypothetical protein